MAFPVSADFGSTPGMKIATADLAQAHLGKDGADWMERQQPGAGQIGERQREQPDDHDQQAGAQPSQYLEMCRAATAGIEKDGLGHGGPVA